jgi:hypothetical protein
MSTAGFFKKCPHTCVHKATNLPTFSYVFFNVGGSFLGHMRSKAHPNCTPSCRGNSEHPQHVEWLHPNRDEMVRLQTALRTRYAHNPRALAALDYSLQSHGSEDEDGDDDEDEEDEEENNEDNEEQEENDEKEEEEEEEEDEPEDEEEDKEQEDEDEDVENKEDEEEDHSVAPNLQSIPVDRHLVERGVSARSSTSFPITSRPPSPTAQSKTVFSTAWVGEDHFDNTGFYADNMEVVFVELPCKYTTKEFAFSSDSWMCQNLLLDNTWVKDLAKKFPKLAFQKGGKWAVWEWVSYDSFIPINLA